MNMMTIDEEFLELYELLDHAVELTAVAFEMYRASAHETPGLEAALANFDQKRLIMIEALKAHRARLQATST
uniref:Uncharacterized protein n=1 Tax=viral metagenome TaxID=1070528 RepID=A0A6H1ZDE9_9ZZZZ